jgi:hypothetical protein
MITYGLGILMMAITYSYQLNLENKENTVYWRWYLRLLTIDYINSEIENELLINNI